MSKTATKSAPEIIVHLVEAAIHEHYDKCRRSHDGDAGWFWCEAKWVGKIPAIASAFDLATAAERWRLEMRPAVPGPCDKRLIAAVEAYRAALELEGVCPCHES